MKEQKSTLDKFKDFKKLLHEVNNKKGEKELDKVLETLSILVKDYLEGKLDL